MKIDKMKNLFMEEQRFTQWWLWALLIGNALLPVYGIYKQLILGENFGDKPLPTVGLVIYLLFTLALIGLFWSFKLKVAIDKNEIRIKLNPVANKVLLWANVKTAELIEYDFVGWGLRLSTKYGTVYNTKGNIGLALELDNGKKYLIGTQKLNDLKKVLAECHNRIA